MISRVVAISHLVTSFLHTKTCLAVCVIAVEINKGAAFSYNSIVIEYLDDNRD